MIVLRGGPIRDQHLEREVALGAAAYGPPGQDRVRRMVERADLGAMRREVRRFEVARRFGAALRDQRGGFPTWPFTMFAGFDPSGEHDDLQGYWKLEEASGTRVDSHTGGLDLTDNNTVTQAAGKQGNAAQFTAANTETLTRADTAALSMGAEVSFFIALWAYLDVTTARDLIHKASTTAAGYGFEFTLRLQAADFLFRVGDGVSASGTVTSGLSLSTATWYFVAMWHDATANTVNINVNNGTTASSAYSGGSHDSAGAFTLGGHADSGFHDGRLDEVAVWKRIPKTGELNYLFNNNNGRTYPLTTP